MGLISHCGVADLGELISLEAVGEGRLAWREIEENRSQVTEDLVISP